MKILKCYWHILVFSLALVFVYYGIDFHKLLFMRPLGEHAWAQIDRASIALLYFQDNVNFLLPQTHNMALNSSGIAIGEFPMQPYFVSLLYKCFGFNEYLYRGTVLSVSIVGFYMAFLIANKLIINKFLCLIVSLCWMLSPNIIYYSTGFLPDTFALSLFLAGFYFLIHSFPVISMKNLLFFVFFSTFSLLEKSSVLFIYMPVCMGIFLHLISKNIDWGAILRKCLVLLLPLLVCFTWIFYAIHIQKKYQSNVFLLKPKLPLSLNDFVDISIQFAGKLSDFYPFFIYGILFLVLMYLMKNIKNVPVIFSTIILGSMASWLIFFIALSRQAWFHGYYHIPFQFIPFVLLLTAAMQFEKSEMSARMKSIYPFFLVLTFYFGFSSISDYFSKKAFHHDLINKDWLDGGLALDQMGIGKNNRIVTCCDHSYNISLYLLNRRGWNITGESWDYFVDNAFNECEFLVLTDEAVLTKKSVKKYVGPFVGQHGSILVFKIINPHGKKSIVR